MLSVKNNIVLTALLLVSSSAYASDYTGFFSAMYLLLVVSISTAINIGLIISFFMKGKYVDRSFAIKHASIAVIIPAIGIVLAIADHRTQQDLMYVIGFNILAAIIALSPLFITKKTGRKEVSGKTSLYVSAILGLIGTLMFPPMNLAAILAGHVAVAKNEGRLRNASIVVLLLCYGFVIFWLYFMLMAMSGR